MENPEQKNSMPEMKNSQDMFNDKWETPEENLSRLNPDGGRKKKKNKPQKSLPTLNGRTYV